MVYNEDDYETHDRGANVQPATKSSKRNKILWALLAVAIAGGFIAGLAR